MFSVVIPLYNKAHTIKQTLKSVLNQTFGDFEIIIVNDGSTDDGVDVIKSEFMNEPRIRIVNQENQGVSVARNRGVAEAKYPYVAFLDGDDEWLPTFLEKVKEAIELYPEAGMYGTSSWHRNMATGESANSTLIRYKGKIQPVDFFENPGTMPHTSAMVVVKEVFNEIDINGEGFPVGMKCCEDWSCFYRIAFKKPFINIGFPLGIRNNNVPGQITGISDDERYKLLKHVVDFYNITYSNWTKSELKSKNYIIYLKYDIRSRILSALKTSEYRTITYLVSNLEKQILSYFHPIELKIYQIKSLNKAGLLYIYFTKILWRTHGFPIVGKNK